MWSRRTRVLRWGQASGARGSGLFGADGSLPAVAGGCRVGGGRRWGWALRRRHATLLRSLPAAVPAGAARRQPTLVLAGWGAEGGAGRLTPWNTPNGSRRTWEGVRRRGLEGLVCSALTGRYRQSLGDAVSAAAAAGVGHSRRRHATFYAPCRQRPARTGPRHTDSRCSQAGWGRWCRAADLTWDMPVAPRRECWRGVWGGVATGRAGAVAWSRVTSVVPVWSRRNW